MISLEDYDTVRIVAVTIDYENIDYEYDDVFRVHSDDFQAYTTDGESLERINQQSSQDAIGKDRTASTQIYFEYPEGVDEIDTLELDFTKSNQLLATFELPVD